MPTVHAGEQYKQSLRQGILQVNSAVTSPSPPRSDDSPASSCQLVDTWRTSQQLLHNNV
jgi:hypothetical protein